MADHIWYIEPSGCLITNRHLSQHLDPENQCNGKLCEDGVERNLWRCEYRDVRELEHVREDLGLTFKVYVQEGQHGKIRQWKFGEVKKATGVVKATQ